MRFLHRKSLLLQRLLKIHTSRKLLLHGSFEPLEYHSWISALPVSKDPLSDHPWSLPSRDLSCLESSEKRHFLHFLFLESTCCSPHSLKRCPFCQGFLDFERRDSNTLTMTKITVQVRRDFLSWNPRDKTFVTDLFLEMEGLLTLWVSKSVGTEAWKDCKRRQQQKVCLFLS